MSGNSRVWHERGFSVKFSQALKSIRNGWLTWTDNTHTMVRDCTPSEQWEIQSQLAKMREPAPWAETPGLRVAGLAFGAVLTEMDLAREATQSMTPMPKPYDESSPRLCWLPEMEAA